MMAPDPLAGIETDYAGDDSTSHALSVGALFGVQAAAEGDGIEGEVARLLQREPRPPSLRPPDECLPDDPALAEVRRAVEVGYAAVHEHLERQWSAREAVRDRWIARLYGPPELHAEGMPTIDSREAMAELLIINDQAANAKRLEGEFERAVVKTIRDAYPEWKAWGVRRVTHAVVGFLTEGG